MSDESQIQWKSEIEKDPIKYGRALKNKRRWQESISYIKSHNLPVEPWAVEAVEEGH